MRSIRPYLLLLVILSLLSAQQIGAAHTISHALEQSQQQDQHAPHSTACEKCENYAQLGSALNAGTYCLALLALGSEPVASFAADFPTLHNLAATARGPPARLQKIA